MPTPQRIQDAIDRVCDQPSFIQEVLIEALDWPVEGNIDSLEDISYGWTSSELRAEGLDKHLVDGQIWQLQPMRDDQPWGIFLLEFKNHEVFTTGRGLTGPLRKVLRGLVASRRKAASLASWKREHLLFICTEGYHHYRFAYFKAPTDGAKTAPLAAFGWDPDVPARTACEFNLPELVWPDDDVAPSDWVAKWAGAFDVEKVTKHFYEDYHKIFERTEVLIGKASGLKKDDLRMFTQTLFNRLMFLRFIERKKWLEFDRDVVYLRALGEAGGIGKKSLYQSRIQPLFFEGLAIEEKQHSKEIGKVPFLNGGLFEENDLDRKVKDIPDEVFEPIIGREGLFYRYNFTIEESTPMDIEVAVDPEMLGKVFEELVTGRHESGSYYTPRPVVAFMCREAIKGFLSDQTKLSVEAISDLVDRREVKALNVRYAQEILAALDGLKAVDPACGSGAYLLGLLQELIAICRVLYNEKLLKDSRSVYDLKMRIISNNLYGVDIDPFATNIARLRLWLSIAVEAQEPLPLPNLDFKIETGDSLLGPDPSGKGQGDPFRQNQIEKFDGLKARFLKARNLKNKNEIRAQIDDLRSQISEYSHPGQTAKGFDWRVEFAEVWQERGGFDIVLANPPYVRSELIGEAKPLLMNLYSSVAQGKSDLFCYFYARGLELLRRGGMHVFICSNSWLDAGYGGKLQRYLLKTAEIMGVYDSSVERQFATADVNTIISILRKGKCAGDSQVAFVRFEGPFADAVLDSKLRKEVYVSRDDLWKGGLGTNDRGHREHYEGDKWGGKYLRAPKIYHCILNEASALLASVSELAEVQGYIHDNNTGDHYPLVPFLKSVKNADRIRMVTDSKGVIEYGVRPTGNSRLTAPILFARTFGSRHLVVWNPNGIYGKEFYKIIPRDDDSVISMVAQLNSTFAILQREILGLVNLGDGAIKFSGADVGKFLVAPTLRSEDVRESFLMLADLPVLNMPEELEKPERKRLDEIIFSHLGLTSEQRCAVYEAVRTLVCERLLKANSRS